MYVQVIYHENSKARQRSLYEATKVESWEEDDGEFQVCIHAPDGTSRTVRVDRDSMGVFVLNNEGKTVEVINRPDPKASKAA